MDSANILSILASLGQDPSQAAAPTNVLQTVAPPPVSAPVAPQIPAAADVAQAAVAASPPAPKPRRSLVDILGHLADGIAQAGGATPMYQRTLDAEQQRGFDVQDHSLKVDSETIRNATDKFALADSERKRLGVALGALDGQADPASLWPSIAEQVGIDPQKSAAVAQILKANPAAAGIIAKSLGADADNLGKNVFFGTTTDGKTVAYQVGPDGKPHILDFGTAGITPNDPIKIVDTGGSQVIVGQSGTPKKILPKTEAPGRSADRQERAREADNQNATTITVAGMPARAKDGTSASAKTSDPRAGLKIISDIQQSFDNLHKLEALPGEGGVLGNLVGAIGRTAAGQAIEAKTGLSPAAQEREILAKNLANLQSDLIKSLPGNATRTRFEQEIQKKRLPDPNTMNYATASRAIAQIRQAYMTALQSQSTPVNIAPKNNGWSVIGVK